MIRYLHDVLERRDLEVEDTLYKKDALITLVYDIIPIDLDF